MSRATQLLIVKANAYFTSGQLVALLRAYAANAVPLYERLVLFVPLRLHSGVILWREQLSVRFGDKTVFCPVTLEEALSVAFLARRLLIRPLEHLSQLGNKRVRLCIQAFSLL